MGGWPRKINSTTPVLSFMYSRAHCKLFTLMSAYVRFGLMLDPRCSSSEPLEIVESVVYEEGWFGIPPYGVMCDPRCSCSEPLRIVMPAIYDR